MMLATVERVAKSLLTSRPTHTDPPPLALAQLEVDGTDGSALNIKDMFV